MFPQLLLFSNLWKFHFCRTNICTQTVSQHWQTCLASSGRCTRTLVRDWLVYSPLLLRKTPNSKRRCARNKMQTKKRRTSRSTIMEVPRLPKLSVFILLSLNLFARFAFKKAIVSTWIVFTFADTRPQNTGGSFANDTRDTEQLLDPPARA